ncbi:MAG: methyltransferase domain-containing protein [Acidobacteria bacterium]|nr:methyltransferase domain-containing protein [Acidobacteriota bacterium]
MDIIDYATLQKNIAIFEELIELFRKRADIPDEKEFPLVKPTLADYSFPARYLSRMELESCLAKDRLDKIRHSIIDPKWPGSLIHIIIPWHDPQVIPPGSVDLIFSQAVLEHVSNLELAYRAMHRWLLPGGLISHQIDFKCHSKASEWNGHWTYSDLTWRLIRGKQEYLLNREPYSTHLRLLRQEGFQMVCDRIQRHASNLRREQLAPRFRNMPSDDLTISGAFIQATKCSPIPAR